MSLEELRIAIALAMVGFLFLLRFDSARFGAAEFDPGPNYDTPWAIVLRGAWPLLAISLASAAAFVLPAGWDALGVDPAGGRTAESLALALTFGGLGVLAVFGIAYLRTRTWPPQTIPLAWVPRSILNALGTALVDEIAFRGVLLSLLVTVGFPVIAAFIVQDLFYGLATRLGADNETLPLLGAALALGAANGLLALSTGAILAPFLVHLVVRFAALAVEDLSLIHISEPTRQRCVS
ncbi:MAG: CPBP family glutamic-type intramembrane protease, partial [Candidatus Eisenbacteria bacterium]|nr:CPBP family glutamic-type intramembrane protease [Candidatus Eisenbacteria bacterium]